VAIEHNVITDPEIHEPKGAAAASEGEVYIADGAASGAFAKPELLGTGWRDLIMPFTASEKGALNAPDFAKAFDDGSGSTGLWGYHFDKSTVEELFMVFHLDHDYKVGTAFYPHVHWCPTNTDTGTVRWGMEWAYATRNDDTYSVFGNGTPAQTTYTYLEQAAGGTAYAHQVIEVADPGVTITGAEPDTLFWVRIFRDASHANDTYNNDAIGLSLDAHYQIDRYATLNRAPDFYT